ncbi:TetR/AcrR family transcriptional regulator [Maribacter sp. ANRC-HE7]|uniref:TetR/AcrR family transcriptional regulator n=1 Tax=Maribacter aquimaris TaxID=2737171 RepID=A0ABR7V2H7_9FLAO|nr:TetR family transcriptional regulator C-terminal domain-containing protein [Maribacter aquimaris]MBD0779018.1 TetR/AcrR family transcriptional regulator [Maribacter aquimaris]
MGAKAKTKKLTENDLITMYMDHVLEHESRPKSVYKFCKLNSISEADFYGIFGSLESIPKRIWNVFFENTEDLLRKNKEFDDFTNKDKMLTFFYSFFELLTLNRSYVLLALQQEKNPLKNLEQLKGLRKHIKNFATVLIEDDNSNKTLKVTKFNPKLFSEGVWFQFLFLLKFWKDDESKGFEKTDMAIEKSVNTIFDVFDNTPLENIIDFGKFLYKETFV